MKERKLVVAYGNNGEIGAANGLPWHLPADMRHFREVTAGDTLILGRKTWESIGRVLPGREMVVVTRGEVDAPDVVIARTVHEAFDRASRESISVIGGASIYLQALEACLVDRIYATQIHADFPTADTFFTRPPGWREQSRELHGAGDVNLYDYDFVTYEKR